MSIYSVNENYCFVSGICEFIIISASLWYIDQAIIDDCKQTSNEKMVLGC